MKISNIFNGIILIILTLLVSSCSAIAGIFKMGMGFGIFIVLAVLVLIVGIAMKMNKK